jgi:hypothetical protein
MNPMRLVRILSLAFLLSGVAALVVFAAEKEDGFVPLFNGKNLDGWVYGDKKDKEAKSGEGYQVKDGVLFCTKGNGGNLFTEKDYENFVLRFDFKLETDSNNGIAIRSPIEGNAAYEGMEIQILDDEGPAHKGIIKPWQHHGSVYGCVAAKPGALKPVGEWNEQEIVADGRHIKVTLNGKVIVDADLDKDVTDPEVRKAHPGIERKTGRIGLLGHGTRVDFRNLRVKELK